MNKSLLPFVAIGLVTAACVVQDAGTDPRRGQRSPSAAATTAPSEEDPLGDPPPPGEEPAQPPLVIENQVNPAKPAFQAKSSTQLVSSIKNCVGPSATTVTSAMIIGSPGGFLTTDFANGQDIVAVQNGLFDGNLESLKTSVRVDQITLEYITALKNVANVVGYRCAQNLVATPSLCTCDTFVTAYSMLSRCLGAVADPSTAEFTLLAADFQAACAANKGRAIASLVASSAFAKLP